MATNTPDGRKCNAAAEWRAYDALPAPLREVVARAPWDLSVRSWTRDLPKGGGAWPARRALIARIVEAIRQEALDLYGSEHPQAAQIGVHVPPKWDPARKTRRKPAKKRA